MGELAMRGAVAALLLLLLGLMLAIHGFVQPGAVRSAAIYLGAALQVLLVVFGFMRLGQSPLLARLAACGIALWLAIFFGLTLLDYLHR